MTLQYTNRVGKIYYLSEGKTKSGKPQYYFTLKEKDNAVDKIPKGYEIYEHPENAQIFMRKIRPRVITELEEQFVKNEVKALQRTRKYLVDCKDEYITIYESNQEVEDVQKAFGKLFSRAGIRSDTSPEDVLTGFTNIMDQNYTAMLRFCLEDKEKRLFSAERFCFRGHSDRWIYLEDSEKFKELVKRNVDLLGTDKFFESPY
jgi:hypothetical protein